MSDNNDHKEQRIGLWLAGGAAGLTVLTTLFLSVWGWENGKIEGSPAYGAASAAAGGGAASAASSPAEVILAAETVESDGARVEVIDGVVKFYFATGKSDLAAGASDALKDVLEGVKAGRTAVISGYHSASGSAALNEELSKQRAFAVRDALLGFGVPESRIELRKPADTEAGQGAQAQRVEVLLAD
ncbi:OmpA family protein [Neisseria leonii]|uniref:OmpA family protein n=1 Tax=Neisseria leonii TaxID=2995413 RepID=UPI00237A4355|nr:OmpA family protein [Neisseria sp. 3986]MDD9324930.1 OmpA family protein [Neisseria sp. 3986]